MLYTNANARNMEPSREVNDKPSMTVPDQAISPQELLRRYATGQPLGFSAVTPVYDDDANGYDVPEFYKMDKLDQLHELQENSERVLERKQSYDAYVNSEKVKKDLVEQDKKASNVESEQVKRTNEVTDDIPVSV